MKAKIECIKTRDLPLSALSGLALVDGTFYVIADDQLSLGFFLPDGEFQIFPLLPGELPLEPRMRKAAKPDWESLALIPGLAGGQKLLVVPSGSKPQRDRAILIPIKNLGAEVSVVISFGDLYAKIRESVLDLNIEGTVVRDDNIQFFQRGNGAGKQNAIITCDLNATLSGQASAVRNVIHYDLGELHGQSLGFTDACAGQDGVTYFLAVAESGGSTYEDGHYLGAVFGQINKAGMIVFQYEITCPAKPEGLWVEESETGLKVYFVTDADDAAVMSALYKFEIPK